MLVSPDLWHDFALVRAGARRCINHGRGEYVDLRVSGPGHVEEGFVAQRESRDSFHQWTGRVDDRVGYICFERVVDFAMLLGAAHQSGEVLRVRPAQGIVDADNTPASLDECFERRTVG